MNKSLSRKGKTDHTVLVVDDDPSIVHLLEIHLLSRGVRVLKAYDGVSGLKTAITEQPDLILLDVMMPAMDGFQVCRFLKNYPPCDRIPIIFLTVRSGVGDRQRSLLRGGDDYLAKPFEFADLDAKLDAHLRERTGNPRAAEPAPGPGDDLSAGEAVMRLGEILDESMFSLSIMEEVSRGMNEARSREEVIKVLLLGCLPDIGLGYDRAVYLERSTDGRKLTAHMALGTFLPGGGTEPIGRRIINRMKDKTLREIFASDLDRFHFLVREEHPFLEDMTMDVPNGRQSWDLSGIPGQDDQVEMADRISSAAARILGGDHVQAVPVVARGELVGALVVDQLGTGRSVTAAHIQHLIILCNQAGLAMERLGLLEELRVKARELERLHNLTSGIITAAGVGIAYLDPDGAVVTWNRAMARITGRTEDEVRGKRIFDSFPDLSVSFVSARFDRVLADRVSERVGHFRMSFKQREGFYDIKMSPVIDRGELQGVVFILEDITQRVRLENRNREVYQYLAGIVDHAGAAIITTDRRGRIKSWNRGAAGIFGWSEEEVRGRSISLLFPGEGRGAKERMVRAAARGEMVKEEEIALVSRSGGGLHVSLTVSPVRRADGEVDAVSFLAQDFTERKRLIGQLVQTEKLASLGVMAAGMAHEINNPLASIALHAQLVAMTGEVNAEGRANLERIDEEVNRISEIVNDLLVYSRARGKRRESIEVRDVLRQAALFVERKTGAEAVTVECRLADGEWPAFNGNPTAMLEIFLNLLMNASDAVSRGGHITVTAGVERDHAFRNNAPVLVASVIDDGHGIPAADLNRIFDPFFTTKPPGKGTGLGLMVVRQLVEEYGGTIGVESEHGRGTVFTVRLPFDGGDGSRPGAPSPAKPPAAGRRCSGRRDAG